MCVYVRARVGACVCILNHCVLYAKVLECDHRMAQTVPCWNINPSSINQPFLCIYLFKFFWIAVQFVNHTSEKILLKNAEKQNCRKPKMTLTVSNLFTRVCSIKSGRVWKAAHWTQTPHISCCSYCWPVQPVLHWHHTKFIWQTNSALPAPRAFRWKSPKNYVSNTITFL